MNSDVEISFLGDISLNDDYIQIQKENIDPFEDISPILNKSDFVIGNLESILVGKQGENTLKEPRLKTSIKTLDLLKSLYLDLATLAHNHIYDHYEDGYSKTVAYLQSNKILTVGAGRTKELAERPIIINRKGIRFCIFNYVDKNTNSKLPSNAQISINYFDINKALADIDNYRKQVDFIIVYLHWGGKSDYSSYPYFDQPIFARKIIDRGCDLIVGGHSHTLQPFEIYKGKYIFYSLGNFCFSDLYIGDKIIYQDGKKARESIIVQIQFKKNKNYDVKLHGIENRKLLIYRCDDIITRLNRRNCIFGIFQRNTILWRINYALFKRFHPYISFFFNDGIVNEKNFIVQVKKATMKLFK